MKETLTREQANKLASVIYRLLERHDARADVLSIAGSLFDTLSVDDVIDLAENWLKEGEYIHQKQ